MKLKETLEYMGKDFKQIKLVNYDDLFVKTFDSYKEAEQFLIDNHKEGYLNYDIKKTSFYNNGTIEFWI